MIRLLEKIALAAVLCVTALAAHAQDLAKVRTFTQTNFPGFVQFVTNELGLFTKYGIDPSLKYFPSGAPIVQAGAANEWDIAFLGAPPAVIGSDSLGIVTIGVITDDPHELFGRPDYVDKALADPSTLKGAKIFVTTLSTGHYMVESCLQKFGLDSKDVTIIPSDQAATVSAFLAGEGDLAQTWQPFSDALRARGNNVLCDAAQTNLHIFTVWVATKAFATQHPDLVTKWVKANGEAVDWIKQDEARTTEMYRKFMALSGQTTEGDALKSVIGSVMAAKTLNEQLGYMMAADGSKPEVIKAYEGIAEFFIRNGRMPTVPDFTPYVDASFLKAAVGQ
jgi:NitT/TauT family transport system substrate-binding protein